MKKWIGQLSVPSRKLVVMLLTVAGVLVNESQGNPVDEQTVLYLVGVVGAWLVGQGIADAAVKSGSEIAATVKKLDDVQED